MSTERLNARLIAAGLERVADDIARLSLPSIRMSCQSADDAGELALGSSKLGGEPDLPPGQRWPAWQDAPMAFVSQVNLADVAALDEEGHLPRSGLLSFFFAVDGTAAGVMLAPDDPSSWRVSHFDGDTTTLARVPRPPQLPERLHFPACRVSFSREATLPHPDSRAILDLKLSEAEQGAYFDVWSGMDDGYTSAFNHRLLGYPNCLDRSPLVAGYLAAHGIPHPYTIDLQGSPEEIDLQVQSVGDKSEELRDLQHKAEGEWRLLLQVYSNEEAEMDWGGGGVLHFCIPNDALSLREFGRVWVDMQFL